MHIHVFNITQALIHRATLASESQQYIMILFSLSVCITTRAALRHLEIQVLSRVREGRGYVAV